MKGWSFPPVCAKLDTVLRAGLEPEILEGKPFGKRLRLPVPPPEHRGTPKGRGVLGSPLAFWGFSLGHRMRLLRQLL